MHLLFFLGLYFIICSCSPITAIQPTYIQRRANLGNLDLLVNDGNGTLIRANDNQRRSVLQQRQEPGQVTSTGNGQCKTATIMNGVTDPACSLFCNIQSAVVQGSIQTVSADIDCTLPTCSTAYLYSTTITDSFSVSVGITASYADAGITAQATLGYSQTWSTGVSATNTYTFTPTNGDVGHIIYIPYMEEACGTLTIFFENTFRIAECLDWSKTPVGANQNDVLQYDPMSCGQTPLRLPDGSANGVCFLFSSTFQ
jgi:hypothetical protein